jgi:putative aldouronate transport system substrate-binding protein
VLRAGLAAGSAAIAGRLGGPGRAAAQEATPGTPVPPGLTVGVDYFPSPAPGVPDAFLKPPAPFQSVAEVPGRGGTVSTVQITYLPPFPGRDENPYWQELEHRLGVTLEPNFVPVANYTERAATVFAGGDLPDLMWVDAVLVPNLGELVTQGAFTDLTDYLTGDALQDYPNLAAFPDYVWRNAAVNGRLYGIPRPRTRANLQLMFRQDWAEAVGMPEPENAEGFRQLLVAFTERDPDGNGRADTWGLSSTNPLYSLAYFQQMFGAPNGWRLGADGRLTNIIETEEHRAAITYARELFAAGVFHPDAASMNTAQAKDGLVAGHFGGYLDGIVGLPGPVGLRARAKQVDPDANVIGLVPFGAGDAPAVYHTSTGYFGYTTIPASAGADEERVRELLRILNYFAAPFGSEERVFLESGVEGLHHTLQPDGVRVKTERGSLDIGDPGSGLSALTNAPPVFYYPETPDDAQYMQGLAEESLAIGIDNPVWGLYSPTEAERGGELGQLVSDRHSSIINGREPLDSLDQMVAEWRSRGGDEIRREYEEALAAR